MELPFIHVIVPVYNVERYIARCLDSLRNQTYKHCAFILVDDGSTDKSGLIAKNYLSCDTRFHLISTDNKGVSSARNTAIDYAIQNRGGYSIECQYITFADPDDWYVSDTSLEELAIEIAVSGADLVYFRNEFRNDEKLISTASELPELVLDGNDISERLIPALIFSSPFYGTRIGASLWRGAFKTQLVWGNGIRFNERFWKGEDWLFYSDFLKFCRTAKLCNKIFYAYYRRADSTINSFKRLSLDGIGKSLFLLEHIQENALKSGVDAHFIKQYYRTRYTQSFLSYIVNIWDFRNTESLKNKFRFTKQLIKEPSLRVAIRKHSRPALKIQSALEYAIVRYPNRAVLGLYGLLYHLAVLVRRWDIGV